VGSRYQPWGFGWRTQKDEDIAASEQSRMSIREALSAEGWVDRGCAGERKGVRGKRSRKRSLGSLLKGAMTAMLFNQQ
jgi:hypothetical protein